MREREKCSHHSQLVIVVYVHCDQFKVEVEEENVVQLAELAEEGALVMMIQMMIIMNHE